MANLYFNLANNYAKALLTVNKNEKAIAILEEFITKENKANVNSAALLAQAYSENGRDLDAFMLLNDYLLNHGNEEKLTNMIKPLYSKLNQNKEGNIENYLASLSAKSYQATVSKYKAEMIKREAPNFSLLNMKGERVTLSELRGKIVVLDFWATWCVPCKNSFPGMQAAVNKYKDDKEVEFYFIDVWEKVENYKDIVENFITEKKYTFNVLFDEMKDRSNNTATSYGVKGVPHKIVIDKEGFIRFESSGASPDVYKIVNEMTTKIELTKKG